MARETERVVGMLITFVTVGAATLFVGLWLQDVGKRQSAIEARLETHQKQLEKAAEIFDRRWEREKDLRATVERLEADLKRSRYVAE